MQNDTGNKDRTVKENDKAEAAGIAMIYTLATAAGLVVRPIGGVDIGIDLVIEFLDDNGTQGYVLIQSKCYSASMSTAQNSIEVKNAETMLDYWRSLQNPVVVIRSTLDAAAKEQGIMVAKSLCVVDVSEPSLKATSATITWTNTKAASNFTVLHINNTLLIEKIIEFRKFIKRCTGRPHLSLLDLALVRADRALEGGDFAVAQQTIAPYVDDDAPEAVLFNCRTMRRQGPWDPRETDEALNRVLDRFLLDLPKRIPVHLEIGYSYLVAAMRDWCAVQERLTVADDSGYLKGYCNKAMKSLQNWREAVTRDEKNGALKPWVVDNYFLYAACVQHVITGSDIDNNCVDLIAHAAILPVDMDNALEANTGLWTYWLLKSDTTEAEGYMSKVWKMFGPDGKHLDEGRQRSPQSYVGAMILCAWTLALNSESRGEARGYFQAAATGIRGVILYPEIQFWMRIALNRFDFLGPVP